MNIPDLVDIVNENAVLIAKLIAEEILLVDTKHQLSTDDALYALAMFYRAAILDLEPRRLLAQFNKGVAFANRRSHPSSCSPLERAAPKA